tara:strand:+ start:467 stop:640 length:174 start_codon:yes stop_codon:yes gene_type:complete
MTTKQDMIGKRVRARVCTYEGREGIVTSVGNEALPIHVTLDGETWETDFKINELDVI